MGRGVALSRQVDINITLLLLVDNFNKKIFIMFLKRFTNLSKFCFSEAAKSTQTTAPKSAQSVPGTNFVISGHKPPALTDNPAGRYAGSLFSAASHKEQLQTVLEDLTHLRGVIHAEPSFREVLKNSAVKRNKQK